MSSSPPPDTSWQAICLCAAWCGVCREWGGIFEELAASHPRVRFGWVDVEDEDDAMGDVDIETFPTMLIAHGPQVRFFGPVQPSAAQVGKLLDRLQADAHGGAGTAPQANALLARLEGHVLPKP